MPSIAKGNAVEYTDESVKDYTLGKSLARFGIAVESEQNGTVLVETLDGIHRIPVNRVTAYGWAGWLPPELEAIWDKHNPDMAGDGWD